jgi:D-alanyl-D-alanine carboxypeptidase (penicillin-binding protein 5/6)
VRRATAAAGGTRAASTFTPSTPPPTPVPPSGSPSPFPTVLRTPDDDEVVPDLSAASAILEDADTGQELFRDDARARRPIASTTKIMTALLVLEKLDLGRIVTVGPDVTEVQGATLGLTPGERIMVRQLLYALLLQSANDAAVALGDAVSGSVPAFVDEMNRRAADLGLADTHFESPNGLDDRGYSSARDMAAIARAAMGIGAFARIARTQFHDVPAPDGEAPRRVQNRNVLLWLYQGATGVKTGFTSPAGFCLVATARRSGRRLVAVVLGDPSEQASFDDAASLLNYGFGGFRRALLVHGGQTVGQIPVGDRSVAAVAVAGLSRLVPQGAAPTIRRRFELTFGITLPIAQGETVGVVRVTVNGRPAGSVDAVAAAPVTTSPSPRSPGAPPGAAGDGGPVERIIRLVVAVLRAAFGSFL